MRNTTSFGRPSTVGSDIFTRRRRRAARRPAGSSASPLPRRRSRRSSIHPWLKDNAGRRRLSLLRVLADFGWQVVGQEADQLRIRQQRPRLIVVEIDEVAEQREGQQERRYRA